jgi:hypothetical protein
MCAGKRNIISHHTSDVPWSHQLAQLADIFNKLNKFKLSIRGRSKSMFRNSFAHRNFALIPCLSQPSRLPIPTEPHVFQRVGQAQS